jgi:hypothetical protein
MPGAEQIASHGRTGKVSATALGSFGRLLKGIEEVIVTAKTEIISLVSAIHPIMNLVSRIDE